MLLIGTNPRYEAPLVNTRLRKAYVHNELELASIGTNVDLSYKHQNLGEDSSLINDVCSGTHPFAKVLQSAKKPAVIIGAAVLERADGSGILATVTGFCKKLNKPVSPWNVFFNICIFSYPSRKRALRFLREIIGSSTCQIYARLIFVYLELEFAQCFTKQCGSNWSL